MMKREFARETVFAVSGVLGTLRQFLPVGDDETAPLSRPQTVRQGRP